MNESDLINQSKESAIFPTPPASGRREIDEIYGKNENDECQHLFTIFFGKLTKIIITIIMKLVSFIQVNFKGIF